MQHGEADLFGFFGDPRADAGAAQRHLAAARGEDLVGVAMEIEAEEFAVFRVIAEDGADGIVGADLFQADLHAGDVVLIDLGSGADLGQIALGGGEDFEEPWFELCSGGPKELGRELQDAAGVGDDLDRLDAGDLVEEPSATGVHELGVAFELEEIENEDTFRGRERAHGMLGEEAVNRTDGGTAVGVREGDGLLATEDDLDVGIAGGPEIG